MSPKAVVIGAALFAMGASSVAAQVECAPVGELSIHTCLFGSGVPVIVLAAGAGQDSRTWAPVVNDLAALGTVVTFDRPGLGRSPGVEGERTPTAIASELRDVLRVLDLPGPLLIVGHSMGGIHALRFAELFPQTVNGVLLLDTPPADFEERRMELLSDAERVQRLEQLAQGRERAAPVVGRERDGAAAEVWDFADFPRSTPLIVTVADSQHFGELGSGAAHRELWASQSRGWLGLSTHSEFRVATRSGHMIHHDRPDLVVDLVEFLIEELGQQPNEESLRSRLHGWRRFAGAEAGRAAESRSVGYSEETK